MYRYILDIKDQKLISVKEELEYLNSYTYLLKERFGDKVQFRVYGRKRRLLDRLGARLFNDVADGIEERAAFARFGL